jgi:hypothetical protein
LEEILKFKNTVAVEECGLDSSSTSKDLKITRHILYLEKQLKLAVNRNLDQNFHASTELLFTSKLIIFLKVRFTDTIQEMIKMKMSVCNLQWRGLNILGDVNLTFRNMINLEVNSSSVLAWKFWSSITVFQNVGLKEKKFPDYTKIPGLKLSFEKLKM